MKTIPSLTVFSPTNLLWLQDGRFRKSFWYCTMAVAAQELKGDIDEEEVLEAIKKLKRNNAVGVDEMQADLIISGKVFLAEPLTALFNKVFHSSYPKAWTVGLITPIFKKRRPSGVL
jgi:hypothetical protein